MQSNLKTLVVLAACGLASYSPAFAETSPVVKVADRPPSQDEELALAALEGLMAQPSERALPILRKVLAGSRSTLVKRRALFVLGQVDSPEALSILLQTSRTGDAALRGEAIRAIGINGDPKALDALQAVYDSGDAAVKRDVLHAWMISDRKDAVFQAALAARTEDEASAAIEMLGAMGATAELRKLGERPNAPRRLVEAYAISGDLASLRKIAESHPDRRMRLHAVSKIGIVDGPEARAALHEIYTRSAESEVREAALQGMMIADDEAGLLSLYRAAKTSDEKRLIMRKLSMMDGDAALQAIDQALEENK